MESEDSDSCYSFPFERVSAPRGAPASIVPEKRRAEATRARSLRARSEATDGCSLVCAFGAGFVFTHTDTRLRQTVAYNTVD